MDDTFLGHEVVIVKNGIRICGTGAALGNVPILQNKAYFEVKLQQTGNYPLRDKMSDPKLIALFSVFT